MLWWNLRKLKSEDKWTRKRAAEKLGKSGNAKAVEPLINLLNDRDSDVRREAAYALKVLGYEPIDPLQQVLLFIASRDWSNVVKLGAVAVEPLIATLKDDSDSFVKSKVAEALAEIGDARAIELLVITLQEYWDWSVRCKAAEALGKIGDEGTVDPLIIELKDKDANVRKAAVKALGKIGNERAVKPLIAALKDWDLDVRVEATEALGKIGTPEAKHALLELENQKVAQEELEKQQLLKEKQANDIQLLFVPEMSDQEMVKKFIELARYYANGGLSADNPSLVNLVVEIGEELNRRGGISEMQRIFNEIPPMQGKRTVEMQWGGIGDWQG